jgi:hypothetical protein
MKNNFHAFSQSDKRNIYSHIIKYNTVKPVYKGHLREQRDLYEQVLFIYRLILYALFMNGENEAALYSQ